MKRMMCGMAVLAALVAGSAQAASVTVNSGRINNFVSVTTGGQVNFSGSLPGLDPVELLIAWSAKDGDGEALSFSADLVNNTGQAWTDFHLKLESIATVIGFAPVAMGSSSHNITNSVFSNSNTVWDFDFVDPVAVGENLSLSGSISLEQETEFGFFFITLYPTVSSTTPDPDPNPAVIPTPSAALAGMIGLGLLGLRRRRTA